MTSKPAATRKTNTSNRVGLNMIFTIKLLSENIKDHDDEMK